MFLAPLADVAARARGLDHALDADQVRNDGEVDEGGHFPALEVPELLAEEVRGFFGGLE